MLSPGHGQPGIDFTGNRFFPPSPSSASLPEYGSSSSSMSVPLPPSYSYGDYQNQRNLQITNHRSSSGGDVTIWKKDRTTSPSSTSTRSDSLSGKEDLIPDIEVIKINPKGENERIEPTQLESELFQHQQRSLSSSSSQSESSFNPFPSYLGNALSSRGAGIYPPITEVNSIADALLLPRGQMNTLKYKDSYFPSSSESRTHSQEYRNTQSPLDQLRNTVSQLPNYKLPDDLVMDYVATGPSLSNSSRNSIPDSLYSKLLKSQQALNSMHVPTSPFHSQPQSHSQSLRSSESSSLGNGTSFGSPPFFDSAIYSTTKQSHQSSNAFPYYTNGGSVSVNEKPAKSIFTPVEQEILDRHRKELL